MTTLRPQSSGMSSKPRQRCTVTAPRHLVSVSSLSSYAGLRVPCRPADRPCIGMAGCDPATHAGRSGQLRRARVRRHRFSIMRRVLGPHHRCPRLRGVREPAGHAGGEAGDGGRPSSTSARSKPGARRPGCGPGAGRAVHQVAGDRAAAGTVAAACSRASRTAGSCSWASRKSSSSRRSGRDGGAPGAASTCASAPHLRRTAAQQAADQGSSTAPAARAPGRGAGPRTRPGRRRSGAPLHVLLHQGGGPCGRARAW